MKIIKIEDKWEGRYKHLLRTYYTIEWRGKEVILKRDTPSTGGYLIGKLKIYSAPASFERHFLKLQEAGR